MSPAATLRLVDAPERAPIRRRAPAPQRPLGDILLESGAVSSENLARALALQTREDLRLGDILLAHGWVSEAALTSAIARQYDILPIDLTAVPPDPRLIDEFGVEACLAAAAVPVRRLGGATVIATSRPDRFDALTAALPESFGETVMAFCPERAVQEALLAARRRRLAARAETRVAEAESCRFWYGAGPRRAVLAGASLLLGAVLVAPVTTLAVLTFWALLTLVFTSALKAGAAITIWRSRPARADAAQAMTLPRLPVVSVMVPLFHEADIAPRLVRRLSRLSYPRELLDICLVTEEDDETTRAMLARSSLPHWMRVIAVPAGSLKTKPRALNFALDFCRGSIIGVWDAEDAPEPGQIHHIVRRFHERGPEVACLQGALDFYNSGRNWLARCFTIEYAGWFRVILPGIARMGLVVPLGGTTLFFRREALERLGGWDAHNVTEDADLGLRLARHGLRTELVATTTGEEANCRLWPWVRQRSRWVKGYAMTWSAHMRDPRALWRQLGPWRFFGVQVLFLGTLSQFLLVPLMWSFWLLFLGLPHPLAGLVPPGAVTAVGTLFIGTELLNVAIGLAGASLAGKRRLWGWVPTLHFYYPLAALAAYKALFEMVARPFYWDKTCHGIADEDGDEEAPPAA